MQYGWGFVETEDSFGSARWIPHAIVPLQYRALIHSVNAVEIVRHRGQIRMPAILPKGKTVEPHTMVQRTPECSLPSAERFVERFDGVLENREEGA